MIENVAQLAAMAFKGKELARIDSIAKHNGLAAERILHGEFHGWATITRINIPALSTTTLYVIRKSTADSIYKVKGLK